MGIRMLDMITEEKCIELRRDFPLLDREPVVYLDNAATAQRPYPVLEAEREFYEKYNANPLRGLYPLSVRATQAYEAARREVQEFLGAEYPEEIIFTRNTTEAVNLAAYSYGLEHLAPGDEVVVSILEHHSNLLPWQTAAKKTGAKLVFLECAPDGTLSEDEIDAKITARTKIAAVGHVSNVLGCVNPVERVIKRAHEVGAAVFVDAAQSVPHMAVDVQRMDADFLAFSGHKLLGPMGIGVLYGKKRLLEAMPPFLTGGEMIESVTRQGAVYAGLPHKFEAGTVNAAGAAGLAAAIRYVKNIGFPAIKERERELTEYVLRAMQELAHVHVLGSPDPKKHTGIISFTVDGVHPHDISEILAADNICIRAGHHCAQPLLRFLGQPSVARASLMFYNTRAEADLFLEGVKGLRERMGYE